jgi:hypothetical protein
VPKFRCYVRASRVVEADSADEALDLFEDTYANHGLFWLDCMGVEDCDQDEEPDMVAGEDD